MLRAPAQAIVGEPVSLLLVAKRPTGRTDFEYGGTIELTCDDEGAQLPPPTTVMACERGRRSLSVTFSQAGEHRLAARDAEHALTAETAPIVVTETRAPRQLYWGDVHGHSGEYACGHGTIDSFYTYARDYAGLDFCALTDHDHMPRAQRDLSVIWDRVKRAAAYYLEPGRFVTFLGYEWTSMLHQKPDDPSAYYGQRQVLFRGDDESWFGCHQPASDTPEKLWDCLAGRDSLVIVHHPAAPTQWSCPWGTWNPELERLVEVHSCWGCSERPEEEGNPYPIRHPQGNTPDGCVQRALAKGYRLGFSAGGDSHDGSPGDTWCERPLGRGERRRWPGWLQHGGLHGLWASDLTRESLWEALRARRCYGTTGARIRVEFGINGEPMGSELALLREAPRRLSVRILGAGPLLSVEVVKNEIDWRLLPCDGRRCSETIEDDEPIAAGDFYYVRVTQADGHLAWSSPIWVDPVEQE